MTELKRSELAIQKLQVQQVEDRKNMLEMFSEMASDPEKFKKLLREFKDES